MSEIDQPGSRPVAGTPPDSMPKLPQKSTTPKSLGTLLKSSCDIMPKDKGINGHLDRLAPPRPSLRLGLPPRIGPGSGAARLEPAGTPGPKARNATAWAVASLTSEGPGQPPPQQMSQAL